MPRLGEEQVLLKIPLPRFNADQAFYQINSAQLVACGLIALLTWVNVRGVREGAMVQNLFTVLKVSALLALILAGFWHFRSLDHFRPWLQPIPGKASLEDRAGERASRLLRSPKHCSHTTPGTR